MSVSRACKLLKLSRSFSKPGGVTSISCYTPNMSFLQQNRHHSSIGKPLSANEIEALLSKPTWSVKALQERDSDSHSLENITQKQLHHLLRLSALPLPESPEQETKMIETLQAQLHFVQAIQKVNTTGIEPLSALRDETENARRENEFTIESLREEFEKEEVVGFAKRIKRKDTSQTIVGETVDALKSAPKKLGRYIVVNTKKS
jgi:aspartyl/glutamyl-tRNA(Asn/Gln) amidotransferase C subunit